MPDENDISCRIKRIRKILGLKQKEFAEKLDVSPPSLSEIESGKYNPAIDVLIKLVKEYKVNSSYLLLGEGGMFVETDTLLFTQIEKFAVNIDDVREFLYYFQRSTILQYYILSMFKTRMTYDREAIQEEVTGYEKKQKDNKK